MTVHQISLEGIQLVSIGLSRAGRWMSSRLRYLTILIIVQDSKKNLKLQDVSYFNWGSGRGSRQWSFLELPCNTVRKEARLHSAPKKHTYLTPIRLNWSETPNLNTVARVITHNAARRGGAQKVVGRRKPLCTWSR